MVDELKAPEAPVVEEPKAPEPKAESLIENRRSEVERLVQEANSVSPAPELIPEPVEVKDEQKPEDFDPVERIKKSVQKRIDKVVAQKKTIEEELAETKAELERLKSTPRPQEQSLPKDDTPPTPEQVEAYIVKMREEGNTKEEIAATRYLIKLEKELALKEVEERQNKVQREADAVQARRLEDWTNLQRDYVSYDDSGRIDPNSDLTLANQNGLLYKTALSLFNDKELHRDFYNDPDVIRGFRRAVSDAYREIHQQGLIKTPKDLSVVPERKRAVLADPSADSVVEESAPSNNAKDLSDADKVREELKARNKNRFKRQVP